MNPSSSSTASKSKEKERRKEKKRKFQNCPFFSSSPTRLLINLPLFPSSYVFSLSRVYESTWSGLLTGFGRNPLPKTIRGVDFGRDSSRIRGNWAVDGGFCCRFVSFLPFSNLSLSWTWGVVSRSCDLCGCVSDAVVFGCGFRRDLDCWVCVETDFRRIWMMWKLKLLCSNQMTVFVVFATSLFVLWSYF